MNLVSTARVSLATAGAVLVAASAAALDPNEFVAGWAIEPPTGAAVFDVPLTAAVYAEIGSLEQVAVLDANGAPLAFFLRSAPPAAAAEQRVTLEASPLYATGSGRATVGVTTSERGTSVAVTPSGESAPEITGFVLDASEVATQPLALELDWRALPQPFLLDVRVEQSTNLTDWRYVGGASVAALAIDTVEVRHARVPIRGNAGGYFRVTASRAVEGWFLERAALVSATADPVAPHTARVAPLAASELPRDAAADALYFDAGGALPVAGVTLAFPGDVGWLRADVAAARSLQGPWQPVTYGELFYSLRFEGQAFTNEPAAVGRQELRYWRVRPVMPLRGQAVELALQYPQEYLRIGANDTAPYLLVAGTLAQEAGPDATFASVWSRLELASEAVPLAALGARRELGGAAALVAARDFPWRTAALWAALVCGVLVVGTMAVRLAREMRSPPS